MKTAVIALLIFAFSILPLTSTSANDFESRDNLCEVEQRHLHGLPDSEIFETLHAVIAQATSTPTLQPVQAGRIPIEHPERCHTFRHTLGGYHGESETEIFLFRKVIEWRGGLASSQLMLCRRTRERSSGALDRINTLYSCAEIAKNLSF